MVEGKNLNKFILGMIILGVTLVIGIFVAATIQTNLRPTGVGGTATNESVTNTGEAGLSATLDAAGLRDGSCGAITAVSNGTGGDAILTTAFTQTGCNIVNATSMVPYDVDLLISYPFSYTADSVSSNASGTLVTSLDNGTAWITILVVVGFAVIVIGMLSSGLGRAGRGGETYEQLEPVY